MKRFYSQSTGSTYLSGVHLQMPDDAVPITEALYEAVIANPDLDKVRSHDDRGLPILIERTAPNREELVRIERGWRDSQLVSSQWFVARYNEEQSLGLVTTQTEEQFEALLRYRQSLRDWPVSDVFPDSAHRPQAPAFLDSTGGQYEPQ